MTKYIDGTEIKEGDRALSPNGRIGTIIKRKKYITKNINEIRRLFYYY